MWGVGGCTVGCVLCAVGCVLWSPRFSLCGVGYMRLSVHVQCDFVE